MTSEGSRDTEDWCNGWIQCCVTEINYILKYIKIENQIYLVQYLLNFVCIFDQINAALMNII